MTEHRIGWARALPLCTYNAACWTRPSPARAAPGVPRACAHTEPRQAGQSEFLRGSTGRWRLGRAVRPVPFRSCRGASGGMPHGNATGEGAAECNPNFRAAHYIPVNVRPLNESHHCLTSAVHPAWPSALRMTPSRIGPVWLFMPSFDAWGFGITTTTSDFVWSVNHSLRTRPLLCEVPDVARTSDAPDPRLFLETCAAGPWPCIAGLIWLGLESCCDSGRLWARGHQAIWFTQKQHVWDYQSY